MCLVHVVYPVATISSLQMVADEYSTNTLIDKTKQSCRTTRSTNIFADENIFPNGRFRLFTLKSVAPNHFLSTTTKRSSSRGNINIVFAKKNRFPNDFFNCVI